jgi:hypothetical protein
MYLVLPHDFGSWTKFTAKSEARFVSLSTLKQVREDMNRPRQWPSLTDFSSYQAALRVHGRMNVVFARVIQ